MDTQTQAAYDGNTLAGPLSDVCGTTSQVATFQVYGPDPGFVGRCPSCESVLVRLVRTPEALWLDLSGMSALRILMPTDSATDAG